MSKIIVSSLALLKFLERAGIERLSKEDNYYILIEGTKHSISIPGASNERLGIEGKDDFEAEVNIIHLVRLQKLLQHVPDQPITMDLGHKQWINIQYMEI